MHGYGSTKAPDVKQGVMDAIKESEDIGVHDERSCNVIINAATYAANIAEQMTDIAEELIDD